MTTHNAHLNKPEGAVLADGCDRCTEHAQRPFDNMSPEPMRHLFDVLEQGTQGIAWTVNDATAITNMRTAIDYVRVIAKVVGTVRLESYMGTFTPRE